MKKLRKYTIPLIAGAALLSGCCHAPAKGCAVPPEPDYPRLTEAQEATLSDSVYEILADRDQLRELDQKRLRTLLQAYCD